MFSLKSLKQSVETSLSENFEVIVGNSPYTENSLYDDSQTQVYPDFYFEAKRLDPKYLTMIFPAAWQTSTNSKNDSYLKRIREDRSLVSVRNLKTSHSRNTQIESRDFVDRVSMILAKRDHDSETVELIENGKFLGQRNLNEVKCWNADTDEIFLKLEKWRNESGVNTIDSRVSSTDVHVPTSGFLKDSQKDRNVSLKKNSEWVLCWGELPDDSHGWGWITPTHSQLTLDRENFEADQYKVFFRVNCGAYAIWRKTHILGPEKVFTSDFIGVYFKKHEEAVNFRKFLKTDFYRFIVSETGSNIVTGRLTQRLVPDLEYSINPRTGKTGWSSDWNDSDLKKLLESVLTQLDWDYISDRVLVSDGYRPDEYED